MALRLTVISDQSSELGDGSSVLIDKGGGSIGRADDNAWVLPDPHRYISAHHAKISYRNGSFIVEDTSTNGLYLNDQPEPVGRLGPQPLRPGDTLRLGAYRIGVRESDSVVLVAADASAIIPFSAAPVGDGLADPQRDIGVDLDISDLLVSDSELSAARRAFDPWGNPIADPGLLQFDSAQKLPPAVARTIDRRVERRMAPVLERSANRPSERPASRSALAPSRPNADAPGALEAFSRGAGVNSRRLAIEGPDRLLQLAGLLLRESLVGLKELARTQREIRQDSGICAIADDPERVALQNLPVEDLLVRLLLGHEQQQLDAVQWLRELFGLASRHDAALMRALRPALTEFTQRLDPAVLVPGSPSSDRFRNITDMPDGRLPHLFAEALARNFNAEIGGGTTGS